MAKMISFVVLVTLILLVGAVFVAVMQQFLLPLFLALLLVIMFRPLHEWFCKKMPRFPRIAALATTLAIVAIVLIPFLVVSVLAATEAAAVAQSADLDGFAQTVQLKGAHAMAWTRDWAKQVGVEIPPDREIAERATEAIKTNITSALRTTQSAAFSLMHFFASFLFGFAIMLVSVYFFFADGPQMVEAIVKLTPMDPEYVRHMFEQFDQVSRAVVLATLLGALGQAVLAGVAYFFVGIPHLFLLTAMTAVMALVPFVGSATVWVPCAIWLYFLAPYTTTEGVPEHGRPGAAIFLTIWALLVVGMADNIIKPYVLRGQSNIHPLLALLSVIGGVQALGPIGLFVGPMVVAFLHALLTLLRGELKNIETAPEKTPVPIA